MRVRERVAWGAVVALAIGATVSMASVAFGGPLDPPGPPASTGPLQFVELTTNKEFTTVLVECADRGLGGRFNAAADARARLDALGADGWQLVGEPDLPDSGPCIMTYTLERESWE